MQDPPWHSKLEKFQDLKLDLTHAKDSSGLFNLKTSLLLFSRTSWAFLPGEDTKENLTSLMPNVFLLPHWQAASRSGCIISACC